MAHIRTVYTSCCCNSRPHCLDWKDDLIAYGTCNAIALYNVEKQLVTHTLVDHCMPINCVRWINSAGDDEDMLLSSSADKVIVWNGRNSMYEPYSYIAPNVKTAYSIVDATHYQDTEDRRKLIIAAADSESRVIIFENRDCTYGNDSDTNIKQIINFKNSFALDVKFCLLSNKFPLLAIGGSESVIRLYTLQTDCQFTCACLLHGHEDWIRGLDFFSDQHGKTFLASCSQDCLIRIWKVTDMLTKKEHQTSEIVQLKETILTCCWKGDIKNFMVTLESVCAGHENWVYSVRWQSPRKITGTHTPAKLLSASMDKTLILWEFDELSGLWLEKVRVGDVGGSTLGFYGGLFSPDGLSVLGHSYQGALHLWKYNREMDTWEPGYTVSGHFHEVEDIVWETHGSYLFSCSADQTVRLHAPHKHASEVEVWHEIARPQIHGYDINCIAMINRCKFVSCADEKVLRVFEAPKNFITNVQNICEINISDQTSHLAEGATIPPLGLSNKAVFQTDLVNKVETEQKHPKDRYPDSYFVPFVTNHPPSEDILLQNTLWPEVQKLYGHGFEIYAVACNYAGTLVASACKANQPNHAGIILWDSASWKQIEHLYSHNLTITQICFSPDDSYLLSVSRDRTWALFKKNSMGMSLYQRVAFSNKTSGVHTRIIWSCSWSHDSKYFVTGSRDKTVIIWGSRVQSDTYDNESKDSTGNWMACTVPFSMQDAVTAVDFAPAFTIKERYLIAVGLEKGEIQLHTWQKVTGQLEDWQILAVLDCNTAHHKTVRRLRFRPSVKNEDENGKELHLASCSYDHSVKIFAVRS